MLSKSKLERKGDNLYEFLPNGIKLEIEFTPDNTFYKKKINKNYEEKCFENLIGVR